jgi:hypothetical protein
VGFEIPRGVYMSPQKHEVRKYRDQYEELRKIYEVRRFELENIITDFELLKEGWTIHFAVDFHQVFDFAFPLGLKDVSLIKDERLRAKTAIRQAARAFVLYGMTYCPPPVLLTPYALELRNFLSLMFSRAHETALKMNAAKDLERYLLTEKERALIHTASRCYESSREERLLIELMPQLKNLVNKKFLDMYFLISGTMVDGVKMLKNLYRGRKIRLEMAYKRWKDYARIVKDVKGYYSRWYLVLQEIKSSSFVSNIHDAMAIEIVMALNDQLMKNKEILLLVSDARAIKTVLDERINGRTRGSVKHPETGEEIRILRTSDTFLTYMTSVEERLNLEDDLKRLYREKSELGDFFAIAPMIRRACEVHEKMLDIVGGDCSSCQYYDICTDISDILKTYKEKIDEIRLLRLILNRFDYLKPYLNVLESKDKKDKIEKNIEEIVRFLGRRTKGLEEGFREKVKDLEREIDDLINAIEDPSIDMAPEDALYSFVYRLKRLNGIPYVIEFKEPRIRNALSSLFRSFDKRKNIRGSAKAVFDLTHDLSLGNEGKLLLASLLYAFRHYVTVKDIALQMLQKEHLEERKEFVLLKCLSYSRMSIESRSSFFYNEAYEECLEAVETYSNDPRFLNMLGAVVAAGIESRQERKKTFADVLEILHEALERCTSKDKMLKIALENNIAYLTTQEEDRSPEEIIFAAELIKEIERVWPRKNWAAFLWDTDACVQFSLVELGEDLSEKKALLKDAIKKERKAIEIGEKYLIREARILKFQERLNDMIQRMALLE